MTVPVVPVSGSEIVRESAPFLDWLAGWYDSLQAVPFKDVFPDPRRGAILPVDLIIGFCSQGPLASDRVNAIVPRTVALLGKAHDLGMTRFLFAQDTHDPNAPEFEAWPPHCVRGTSESRMVPELASLPFASEFQIIEKNALSAAPCTGLERWLEQNDDITDYLITGDCTDLCVYNQAMYVRMWANASNRHGRRVTVDASAVQTYELSVSAAAGGMPHPGDFLHMLFLYHLALNGIRIVSKIV